MGCNYSRIEREEMLKRCKSRKKYMKQFVKSTKALSCSHGSYLISLRTATSSSPPPPPPPPPPQTPHSPPRTEAGEEEEGRWTSGLGSDEAIKDFDEIVREISNYFAVAADSGAHVSSLLEISISNPNAPGKVYTCGRSLSPLTWSCGLNSKFNGFGEQVVVATNSAKCSVVNTNLFGTVQKLYVLEKQLYSEAKKCDATKKGLENKVTKLQNLETSKMIDTVKIERIKKEIGDSESAIRISLEYIDTNSNEIVQLRELQLYPLLIQLVKGYGDMWRIMNKCHEAQMQKVQHFSNINTTPTVQSIHQLKIGFDQWRASLFTLIQSQKDFIQSIGGWLRLCLFSFDKRSTSCPLSESNIYLLCEKWRLMTDLAPLTLASEGMNSFRAVIYDIAAQQEKEENQKRKYESTFRELEKKTSELGLLEKCDGRKQELVVAKRATVKSLLEKTDQEKGEYVKIIGVSKAMILELLRTGFKDAFQGMAEFSSVCTRELESLCNYGMIRIDESNDMEMTV